MHLIVLAVLSGFSVAQSNTNFCYGDIRSDVQACLSGATPRSQCCSVYSQFYSNKCLCNELMTALIPPEFFAGVSQAAQSCSLSTPSCASFNPKSYNGGTCSKSDTELDQDRFFAAQQFSSMILDFTKQTGCFNISDFARDLLQTIKPDAVGKAGFGLGVYRGVMEIAEYFSLLAPQVNKYFMGVEIAHIPSPTFIVADGGQSVVVGIRVRNKFVGDLVELNSVDYLETKLTFNGCESKASLIVVPPQSIIFPGRVTGVAPLAQMVFNAMASNSQVLGVTNICKHHTKFCTKFPQFSSEQECINFMKSLPIISPTCGKGALLSGNTSTCRTKHTFMAAVAPDVHCPHLGRVSSVCNDSKCEEPGDASAISTTQYQSVRTKDNTQSLTGLFREIDTKASSKPWQFANFCNSNNPLVLNKLVAIPNTTIFRKGFSVRTDLVSLEMQASGKFVLSRLDGTVLFETVPGDYVVFQSDGNLVVRKGNGPVWSTKTNPGNTANRQNLDVDSMNLEGEALVIYADGRRLWSSQ